MSTPEREAKINIEVAETIGWDDRKELAWIFQNSFRIDGLTDELYRGLIDVAQFGARRAVENLLPDDPEASR